MAAQTVTQVLRNNSDAEFRAWGKSISDQLLAGGMVKTADTGNDSNGNGLINWASVLTPSAISQVRGYEIWRSNDAAGSIVNYYIKLEWGSSSAGASAPAIWLTVGWGSDGSGNLTATGKSTRTNIQFAATGTASSLPCNLAAGNNWAAMFLGNATNNTLGFAVERCKDSSLADMNQILVLTFPSGGSFFPQVVSSTTTYAQESSAKGQVMVSSANAVVGTTVGLGLWFGCAPGLTNPSLCVVGVASGQLGAAQNTLSFNHYGSSHTYIVNAAAGITFNGIVSNLLTRFE